METQQFDALIKRLSAARLTRADALRQLGAGALVLLGGASLAETPAIARRQHSKRGASRLHAQKADAGKVTICHFTGSEKHPYNVITVSQNAFAAHQKHGDFAIDPDDPLHCCLDTDCADTPGTDQCNVGICQSGTCSTKPVDEATPCDDGNPCTIHDACGGAHGGGRHGAGECSGTPICPDDARCDPDTLKCEPCIGTQPNGADCKDSHQCCSGCCMNPPADGTPGHCADAGSAACLPL
jgi:hypothetical protein